MKIPTRVRKENIVIDGAEKVFAKVGYKNARMEDIAKVAGITKVTLYTYFQSKENLYMAITYRALQALVDGYKRHLQHMKGKNGLETTLGLMDSFMSFCEEHYLYSEAMLDYFSLVRSTAAYGDEDKLTDALRESNYFQKIQGMHNDPYKLNTKEIKRGIEDGSIKSDIDPMFQTLHTWTMVVGYAKIIASSGDTSMPLFNVSLKQLKNYNIELKRQILAS